MSIKEIEVKMTDEELKIIREGLKLKEDIMTVRNPDRLPKIKELKNKLKEVA